MDEWDAIGPGMKIDRRATDWGLAACLIGGVMVAVSPMFLIFNLLYWRHGFAFHHPAEVPFARIGAVVISIGAGVVIAFGLYAGFRGLGAARTAHQPAALPLAGIFLAGLATLMWLGLAVNLFAIMGMIG